MLIKHITIEALLVNVLRDGDKEENRRQCLPKRVFRALSESQGNILKLIWKIQPEMYSRLMGGEKGSTYLSQGKNHREKTFSLNIIMKDK